MKNIISSIESDPIGLWSINPAIYDGKFCLFIHQQIDFSIALQLVRLLVFFNFWPVKGRIAQRLFTGAIMNTTDSAMKKTMTFLMVALFGMFLSIITLANYIAQ